MWRLRCDRERQVGRPRSQQRYSACRLESRPLHKHAQRERTRTTEAPIKCAVLTFRSQGVKFRQATSGRMQA